MICRKISLRDFKCHADLHLPLAPLTVLAGLNSAGKSTVLQAFCLLSQTIRQDSKAETLLLNGDLVELGTMADLLNESSPSGEFFIGLEFDSDSIGWSFGGSRKARSGTVNNIDWRVPSSAGEARKNVQRCANPRVPALGLLPEPDPMFDANDEGRKQFLKTMSRMAYISPERLSPRALYEIADNDQGLTIGRDGKGAASILYYRDTQEVQPSLRIADVPPSLPRQVEARMARLFPGFAIQLQPVEGTNYATLRMRSSQSADFALPQNVGFGLSHVLPIITACLHAEPDDIVLLDNPEAHLHPAGQAELARFLGEVSATGVQVVVETHSDHILNGVRIAVKDPHCPVKADDVLVHFFLAPKPEAKGGETVQTLAVDAQGNMDHWPPGFFDQYERDLEILADWE